MTENHPRKILIVLTKAPYGSSDLQEAVDIVLAAGTFDQDINLLISADACYLLLSAQQSELIQQKNIGKMLNALPIYGIEKIFVDADEAHLRGINPEVTTLPVQFSDKGAVSELYRKADTVIRF